MSRGAARASERQMYKANAVSDQFNERAQSLYSSLFPQLQSMAVNPQGFSEKDLNDMNTANMQTVGGSTSGITGQANLTAARTRNAGSFAPAVAEAQREGGRQLNRTALDIRRMNAEQRERNRGVGLAGLGSLYGTNAQGIVSALGQGNSAIGNWNNADQNTMGWFNAITNMLGTGAQAAKGGQ